MKFDEGVWRKWRDWIEQIESDLTTLVYDRAVYLRVEQIVRENVAWIDEHHGGTFWLFLRRNYGGNAIMGIRRHLKDDEDSVSFLRLLRELRECAPQITYAVYSNVFPERPDLPHGRVSSFKAFAEGGTTVSQNLIAKDIESIQLLNRSVEQLADKTLAHLDRRGFDGTVTFEDIVKSIENYNELACRYITFFTGAAASTLEPVLPEEWEDVFHFPLIAPKADAI